jgi:hypothetical protein
MSRLVEQIRQAVAAFSTCKTPPALIGDPKLAPSAAVRPSMLL